MVDSLELFGDICDNGMLQNCAIILILNKTDRFREKISDENKPITLCPAFNDYTGDPHSFEETTDYIKQKFMEKNKSSDIREILTFFTCALDQDSVKNTFDEIFAVIPGYWKRIMGNS